MKGRARSASDTLLTPALRRYLAAPILRLVPSRVSANAITLAAHACLYAVPFVAAIVGPRLPALAAAAIVLLILLFAIGDELDGMQAQRTRTTSSLGEFLDHYLDSFGPGVLLYAAYALYRLPATDLLLVTIGCTFLTGSTLYLEHLRTGTMVFEAISTTEGLAFAAVVLGLGVVPAVQRLARLEVLPGYSVLALFLLAVSAAVLVPTAVRSFVRTHAIPILWLLLAFGMAAVIAGLLLTSAGLSLGAAVLVLYGCSNAGALILRRLRPGRMPVPDPVAPVALLAAALVIPRHALLVQAAVLVYLGARCAWIAGLAALRLPRPGRPVVSGAAAVAGAAARSDQKEA